MKTITQFQLHDDISPVSLHDIKNRLTALSNQLLLKIQEATTDNPDYVSHPDSLLSDISLELSRLAAVIDNVLEAFQYRQLKIKLDLSVAQLACLLRMFIESEFITNRNISALIRAVAMTCETRRSEHLSPRSLRVKYYEIEDGTLSTVRDILTQVSKWPPPNP